jgi:dUTP pyrophosphatase
MRKKVIYKSQLHLPQYVTKAYAGYDLRANFEVDLFIKPIGSSLNPADIFWVIRIGYKAEMSPGSHLSFKNCISIFNSRGSSMDDCKDDVCMMKMNLSEENFVIREEERINPVLMTKHK